MTFAEFFHEARELILDLPNVSLRVDCEAWHMYHAVAAKQTRLNFTLQAVHESKNVFASISSSSMEDCLKQLASKVNDYKSNTMMEEVGDPSILAHEQILVAR